MSLKLKVVGLYSGVGFVILKFFRPDVSINSAGSCGWLQLKIEEANQFHLATPNQEWVDQDENPIPYGKFEEVLKEIEAKKIARPTYKTSQISETPQVKIDLDELELDL